MPMRTIAGWLDRAEYAKGSIRDMQHGSQHEGLTMRAVRHLKLILASAASVYICMA